MEYLGRNRRYYRITSKGRILLSLYKEEWEIYKEKIDKVFDKDFAGKGKNINLGEIIESLKLAEKIENLKIDEKIELIKSEGMKLGKKFDDFLTGKIKKPEKPETEEKREKKDEGENK
jgi:hypothetical protein